MQTLNGLFSSLLTKCPDVHPLLMQVILTSSESEESEASFFIIITARLESLKDRPEKPAASDYYFQ